MSEYHPELDEYVPHDDKPLLGRRLLPVIRVIVVLAVIGLVLPGILTTWGVAQQTAETSCAVYTDYLAPDAVGHTVRFEFSGPQGPGWNCYAIDFRGAETLVHALGLIPVGVTAPRTNVESS